MNGKWRMEYRHFIGISHEVGILTFASTSNGFDDFLKNVESLSGAALHTITAVTSVTFF